MNYVNKIIAEATSEELLHALININGLSPGPKKTVYAEPIYVSDIPIGPDRTARITVFADDISILHVLLLKAD